MRRLGPWGILNPLVALVVVSSLAASAHAIGISFLGTSDSTLEDAVLFTSVDGAVPVDSYGLGDFDLSTTAGGYVVDIPVDARMTHWWLIAHRGDNIVYSSNLDLNGVDLFSIEPFDTGLFTADAIDVLEGVNGGGPGYTFDQWATLAFGNSSHDAIDEEISQLWLFASPGQDFGLVSVSMFTNTPPPVPEPATVSLLLAGALFLMRRRRS